MSRQNWRGRVNIQFWVLNRITWECSRYSISDDLQDNSDLVVHLALLLFEIGFKLRQSSILRRHEGVTKIVLLGFESVPLASRFVSTLGHILNKSLLGIFHAVLSIVGTAADLA
ncbi:hypothetical protein Tco_0411580 [Tanacetum coccineum]